MSYASAVGNALENDLFYEPKSKLGLAVLLRGTGMVFHREILERFPWKAYSVAEDVQYALQLIRNGVRITFLPDVRVFSPFPVTREQLTIQAPAVGLGRGGAGQGRGDEVDARRGATARRPALRCGLDAPGAEPAGAPAPIAAHDDAGFLDLVDLAGPGVPSRSLQSRQSRRSSSSATSHSGSSTSA